MTTRPARGDDDERTSEETRWRRNANGSRRTTTRPSASPSTATRQGDHQRLPEAGQEAPSRRQPGRGGDLQGDLRGLRRARRRRPSQGVRRGAGDGPGGRASAAASPAGSVAAGAPPSGSRTWATSATCSVACSAAVGAGGGATGPQRGADVETELHLSFEDAVNGVTTSVNLTTDVRCHTCLGSGSAPGTQPTTCPRCGGTRHPPGQPGPLLPEPDLSAVRRPGDHRHHAVPDLFGAPASSTATVRSRCASRPASRTGSASG